jgi:hypothetical protein
MPWRSNGVPAAGGPTALSAAVGAAEATRVSAISAIEIKAARSTRRSPGARVLLVFTSTFNTVARLALRFKYG